MGTLRMIKKGEIPLLWYGHCNYCNSVMEYKRNDDERPPLIKFKRRCPLCGEIVNFYCNKTDQGRSINISVPFSERNQTKTIKCSVPLNI
jgi:predicted DCC family thiol-disulfide oxidoreductase YuxK